jgi:hypothetical protein
LERSRLKNIIILILALVNVFLLVSLASRRQAQRDAHQRTVQEITALFAADEVSLDMADLPEDLPPAGRRLSRSTQEEGSLMTFLLGSGAAASDAGGGIYTYTGPGGSGSFRSNGAFSASGSLGDDGASACRGFCSAYGYRSLHYSSDGDTASATKYCGGYPVVGCTVTFHLSDGRLTAAEGTYLPESYSAGENTPMTAATALVKFLAARRETGAVVSSVSGMYLCYQLVSSAAEPMALVSAWAIITDTVNYYVNCSTGAVTYDR